MRKPIVAGNWKMFKGNTEATAFLENVANFVKKDDVGSQVDVFVACSFLCLEKAIKTVEDSALCVAAQNCHDKIEGAFTGEISIPMLQDIGCKSVLIGHSERRQYYNESDGGVNLKTRAALNAKITPIVCVGESLAERESGQTNAIVARQIETAFSSIDGVGVSECIIAYEPIWAIGTGKTATPSDAQDVHQHIRSIIEKKWGTAIATQVRILYGGSVKPANISALIEKPDIDGGLIGGASLDTDSFKDMISKVYSFVSR